MTTRYLYARAPDGTVVRRRTAADYTHAVLVHDGVHGWEGFSWHTRYDLAYRSSVRTWGRAVIVPVTDDKEVPA